MARHFNEKRNLDFLNLPIHDIYPSEYLNAIGLSRKLIWWYVKTGKLKKIAPKLYAKNTSQITWSTIVHSLQTYLDLPIHISGKSALELLGRAHNIPVAGMNKIYLCTSPDTAIPTWIDKVKENHVKFKITRKNLFQYRGSHVSFEPIIKRNLLNHELALSSPELAIIEIMSLVPQVHDYYEANNLIEGLQNLRPQLMQQLLEDCVQIKAKRLLLHCAEKAQCAWLSKININNIELGAGKQKIGSGGDYDPKYLLSVPTKK